MIANYLKIAWRNLVRNKASSFINVVGLTTGMMVAMLIGLWMYDEISYDRNYPNYKQVARVMQNQTFNAEVQTWRSQALQLGPELRNAYGNNFKHVVLASWTGDHLLGISDKKLTVSGNYMDAGITDMLSLKMIHGTGATLSDPSSILLSESTANALFKGKNPINELIKIDNKLAVKVAGVYRDLPSNSSFADLHFIASWNLLVKDGDLENRVNWGNSWFQIYVQIADNVTMQQVSRNIRDSKLKRVLVEDDDARFKPEIFVHPMSKWHLYSEFENGVNVGGRIRYAWLFGIIGVFVLLLACINFMNLSTAHAEKRAKEVGIRKAIGSDRSQLIKQFFGESLLLALCAFIISLIAATLILPYFNEVSDKNILIPWQNQFFWLIGIGFCLFTGLIAGSYPAIYLSSFKPVKVLKGNFRVGRLASLPRKCLVVVQFTVSIALIIGTVLVFKQIQFAKERSAGYDRKGLVSIPVKTKAISDHYDVFRQELLNTGVIEDLAASETPLTSTYSTNSGFSWQGEDPQMEDEFVTLCVTHEFGKTAGWEIIAGRDFSKQFASDTAAFVINESAAKYMGMKDPVGQTMEWNDNGNWKIIGVVKDMITQSPYEPVKQMLFLVDYKRIGFINIRLKKEERTSDAISTIGRVFKKYDTENIFEFKFTDQEYARKFDSEETVGQLAGLFTLLAILISCLGLFGLSSFVALQRRKEVGIRKVLGASVIGLWKMLSKEFLVLVFISCFIAIPIAYYFLHGWLENYEYRTKIAWWIFVVAGGAALIITLVTVSFQAIRAAVANPVKILRNE